MAMCQVVHPEGSAVGVGEEWIASETVLVLLGGCQVAWPLLQASSWGVGVLPGQLEKNEVSQENWFVMNHARNGHSVTSPPLRSYFKDWLRATGWGARL